MEWWHDDIILLLLLIIVLILVFVVFVLQDIECTLVQHHDNADSNRSTCIEMEANYECIHHVQRLA